MKDKKQLTAQERLQNLRESSRKIDEYNQSLKDRGTYSPSRFTDSEVSILMPVAAQPKAKE